MVSWLLAGKLGWRDPPRRDYCPATPSASPWQAIALFEPRGGEPSSFAGTSERSTWRELIAVRRTCSWLSCARLDLGSCPAGALVLNDDLRNTRPDGDAMLHVTTCAGLA